MRDLDNVARTSSGDHVDTETHNESTNHELLSASGVDDCALDDDTDDNDSTSNHHSDSSSPGINGGADEWNRGDGTNLGHGGDNTSTNTDVANTKEGLEAFVTKQVTEHGTIESVGGGAEETDDRDEVELDGYGVPWNRRLLEHGLGVVVIAMDKLGLDDVSLVKGSVLVLVDIGAQLFLADVGHCIEILAEVCR